MSRAEIQVFDKHNTLLDVLPRRKGLTWTDELNGPGSGSFQVSRYDDKLVANPNLLNPHNLIKIAVDGTLRSGFRIEQKAPTLLANGERSAELITVAGPGFGSFLKADVLEPRGGITAKSSDERAFTYASLVDAWYNAADWSGSMTSPLSTDGRQPIGWPDAEAAWIWPPPDGPLTTLPAGATAYFRGYVTLSAQTPCRVYATGDNQLELFVDEQLILAAGPDTTQTSWRTTNTYDMVLDAGQHLFAAKVVNAVQPLAGYSNPAGFLFALCSLDANGNPFQVLLRSAGSWDSTTATVGWHAAQILKKAFDEAKARVVATLALDLVTTDFTDTVDSAGVAWTDRLNLLLPIGQRISQLAPQLAELGPLDFAIGPDLVLHAWKQRGTDRTTGANPVRLIPGRDFLAHSMSTEADLTTRVLVRSGAGWVEVADSTAETTYGRWADQLQFGSSTATDQTTGAGNAGIGITANPQVTFTSQCQPGSLRPYVDFDLGDKVQVPDDTGAWVSVTVVGFSFTESDDGTLTYVPVLAS